MIKALIHYVQISTIVLALSGLALAEMPAPPISDEAPASEAPAPAQQPAEPAYPAGSRVYVSDELKIALRTGPTTRHRISAFLMAGTPMNVISSQPDWVEVQLLNQNETGWVQAEYTQTRPGAQARLEQAQAQNKTLKEQIASKNQELQSAAASLESTQSQLQSITGQFDRLNKEFSELEAISAAAIENHDKLEAMRIELAESENQYSELEIAYKLLQQDNYNRGFIHGLIAIAFGMLATLILPKLTSKQRSNRW